VYILLPQHRKNRENNSKKISLQRKQEISKFEKYRENTGNFKYVGIVTKQKFIPHTIFIPNTRESS
jgi:hypothetical protein